MPLKVPDLEDCCHSTRPFVNVKAISKINYVKRQYIFYRDIIFFINTQSGKGCQDLKKLLVLGPPNSKNLGNFLQHMQKSKSFDYPFWRNLDLKFFPYINQT